MNTPLSTATQEDMILYYLYCLDIIILAIALTVIVVKPLIKLIPSFKEWFENDTLADIVCTVILIFVLVILENEISKAILNHLTE